MSHSTTVHEPEAELLTAEEALEDARRLLEWHDTRTRPSDDQGVPLLVPMGTLLRAIDSLDAEGLRRIHQHAEERLTSVGSTSTGG